jgi:hypothetical protein
MDPYATHLEALVTMALRAEGNFLEMGCGDYSTPVLAAIAQSKGRRLLVQAQDAQWAGRYRELGPHVEVELVAWAEWKPRGERYGLAFLDSEESTADRIRRLPALREVADCVVMHDADKAMARPHWAECSAGWCLARLYWAHRPHTAVLLPC